MVLSRATGVRARMHVAGAAAALSVVALAGPAAPAHADASVSCGAAHALGSLVFGFACTGIPGRPQPGSVADPTHLYQCTSVQASGLTDEGVMGSGCTLR